MPVYRIVDDAILEETEYRARADEIAEHLALRSEGLVKGPLPLSFGRELGSEPILLEPRLEVTEAGSFTPIGIGKPLTVELRHVYTGRLPKSGRLFGRRKDVAVISSVKDYSIFAASSRALNFIERQLEAHSHLKVPSAFSNGTPVIAYYPSVVADSLTLSVELATDDFPEEFVEQASKGLQAAGGIPLLMPYAGYLLGAGVIVHLAGNLSNVLLDGGAEFTITESIPFDSPGVPGARADFRLLCHAQNLPIDYDYVAGQGLVHRETKALYAGDEPYIVISLDGKSRPGLEEFAPTIASASVLKRFFDIGDKGEASVDAIMEGLKLASDMRFRDQALQMKQRIAKLPDDDPDRARLEAKYSALVKNIVNSLFLPS
ncbi:hypothetical protein [Pseudomonas sp. G5(2012)]|uniref:hypothetical protein n=1 Tax=Pseudomonas sp. G5(2012) TaxID=1268068 RepID=UPI0003432921|nr:hypothetical protein [Pseudomonas sp. G5(2012)]EPA93652.1 hypothetical protein PG5_58590 [Pseudomonas sp. G5(2012)]